MWETNKELIQVLRRVTLYMCVAFAAKEALEYLYFGQDLRETIIGVLVSVPGVIVSFWLFGIYVKRCRKDCSN